MKKALSLILMMAVCLTLIPLNALAYGDQWIQMEKSNFDPNEEFTVTVSGITAQMVADDAYVSIYRKGAAHTEYQEWHRPEQPGTSRLEFTAPVESGDYEMRLYRRDYTYQAEDLVTAVPFTIGAVTRVGTISLNKTAYTADEQITVTVTGITAQMVTTMAFVAIYEKGGPHGEYIVWEHVTQGNSTLTFRAPDKNGEFEMRLYSTDHLYTDETFVMSVPFTVTGAQTPGALTLNKTTYAPNEEIVATVTRGSVDLNIVGIWKPGAAYSEGQSLVTLAGGSQVVEGSIYAPLESGDYEARLYDVDGNLVAFAPFTVADGDPWGNASGWATGELKKAEDLGLIPGVLYGTDFTRPITRAEFAAVSVKLYENLTGNTATPVSPNPFTDTSDPEVLKAYKIGAVNGTSDTTFAPNATLTREQMATMLTRVLKSAYIEGWTLATDAQFTLNFTMPAPFTDDALISGYARQSVYFMSANGIIGGTGNNNFSPRAASTSEAAVSIASATREQSLAIAVRMVENLKDKPVDYN